MKMIAADNIAAASTVLARMMDYKPYEWSGVKYLTDLNNGSFKATITKPRNPKGAVYRVES